MEIRPRAAQSAIIRNAELHVDETVQAPVADQSEIAFAVPIEDEVFAENAHLAHRILAELGERCDRDLVTAHKLAAWGSRADAGQALVGFGGQHDVSLPPCAFFARNGGMTLNRRPA